MTTEITTCGPLSPTELRALTALVDTIFPPTTEGPGAAELGVVTYIAGQLDTGWGRGEDWYRSGPFETPDHAGHGWQSPLTPLKAYRSALEAAGRWARSHHGSAVADLTSRQLHELVAALASGHLAELTDVPASEFFLLLRSHVVEGVLRDPVFGGNTDGRGRQWLLGDHPEGPTGSIRGESHEFTG